MRITQQMIVQSGIKLTKTENVDLSSLVGKILHGKISGSVGETIAVFSTGDLTLTVDLGNVKIADNQSVSLEISEYKDGTFFANVIKDSGHEGKEEKLGVLMNRLGLQDTPENRAVLETIKMSGLPLTKANFSIFKQGMNEIKTLASELTKSSMPIMSKQLDEPIKAIVLDLIHQNKDAESEVPKTMQKDMSPFGRSQETIMARTGDVQTFPPNALAHSENRLVAAILEAFKSAPVSEQGTTDQSINVQSDKVQLINDSNISLGLKDAVIALLKQSDLKQEALIIKNELPITLKNLFVAYDILEGKGMASRLITILEKLERTELPSKAMVDLIEVIASSKTQEEKLEAISIILSEAMLDPEEKASVLKELNVIKESVPFSKGLNDQMLVMQLPVPINDQIEHVEIYYKRRNQKTGMDDFVILVSLGTHHYGEVRCLIQKKGKEYFLNFSLEDDKTKDAFELKSDLLKTTLDKMVDKRFKVSFTVKDHKVESWSETDKIDTFGFDLKV